MVFIISGLVHLKWGGGLKFASEFGLRWDGGVEYGTSYDWHWLLYSYHDIVKVL